MRPGTKPTSRSLGRAQAALSHLRARTAELGMNLQVWDCQGRPVGQVEVGCRLCKLIDRRLAPGEDVAVALDGFSSILQSLQKADRSFEYDIKVKSQYEACLTPPQSHLARTLGEVLQAVNGQAPRALMMTAGCDMRYCHAAGIPTVIYGPADLAMAHQPDEYVELDRVVAAAQVYALTAMRLLGAA